MTKETERTFEVLNRELLEAVEKLETGDLPLAESLALFERATTLAGECNALLDGAELRVRQLIDRPAGELAAEPFTDWEQE